MKHLLTLVLVLCLGTFASAQIPSYVPTNGLVGWWPFNGNANDESGNGNHGTVNGATLAADRFGNPGKAYSFDGNSKINLGRLAIIDTLDPNRDISYSLWFLADTNQSLFDKMPLISKRQTFWAISGYSQSYFTLNGGGQANSRNGRNICTGWIDAHFYSSQILDGGVTNDNFWHNLIATKFGNTYKLYFDGTLYDSILDNSVLYSIDEMIVGFQGVWGFENEKWYKGKIDDIAIYNRALTAAEVQQLYLGNSSNTAAATVPGKIHYQGLAVGANGKPIKNGTVGLRLSVLDSLPNGITLYTETQTASTDAAGIFSTYLGGGTVTAGTFTNIPWANGNNKFLKVEMDAQGGTNYQNMGSTQLVSVPYALHAGSAQRATELMDSAGNAYQIKIVNGQPTLVSAPGNVSTPGTFACGQSVTYAGESYPTVQIGTQCWFQKNVNAGTMVLGANDQTNNGILEKYCYNNDTAYCSIYGGLYQWAEAVQYQNGASNTTSPSPAFTGNVQGICPTGWHVPSDGEFCTLATFLDSTVNCSVFGTSSSIAGGMLKSISSLWTSPNTGATNSSGFSALPGGYRLANGASFFNIGIYAAFWSSYESSSSNAIGRGLGYNSSFIDRNTSSKNFGFSVRCLKD
jgi:uncharacterized protein (TIGR02145 family)